MKNILLTLSYDGKEYCGLQMQKSQKTVEGVLKDSIEKLYLKEIKLISASRTDKGVHALGQRMMIVADNYIIEHVALCKIPAAINSFLPRDISVLDAIYVPGDFHPRYMAVSKTYEYKIVCSQQLLPIYRFSHMHLRENLDRNSISRALPFFLGSHDFSAFCSKGSSVQNTVRRIIDFSFEQKDNIFVFRITADGFLYNMIRIMMGTVIDIGLNKLEAGEVKKILEQKNRALAGTTAEAHALTLIEIKY